MTRLGLLPTLSYLLFLLLPLVAQGLSPSSLFYSNPLSIFVSSENVAVGESVTIRCHINPSSEEGAVMAQSSMILYCPATPKDTFCFQNCRPLERCDGPKGCRVIKALEGVKCRSITQASGEIVYEYTIEKVTPEWIDWRHPGFACQSAAEKTQWIALKEEPEKEPEAVTSTTTPTPETTTTTTTTTTTRSSKTTISTTTTTPKPVITPEGDSKPSTAADEMKPGVGSSSTPEKDSHWLNFLWNSSSGGGFLTPEIIITTSLAALALSVLINIFCCVNWFVRRHHRNRRKAKGVPEHWAMSWTTGGLDTQSGVKMSPSMSYRGPTSVPYYSPVWTGTESESAPRSHPEGKASSRHMGDRSSDSGFSLPHVVSPQPIQLVSSPLTSYPMAFGAPIGWSEQVTPRSRRQPSYRGKHHTFVPSCYVGMKQATSRETVFSDRPMSVVGYEPTSHQLIPLVLSPAAAPGVRASQSQIGAGYAARLCSSADVSLTEKPGAGDGASAGGGSGSPKMLNAHQFGVIQAPVEQPTPPILEKTQTLMPEPPLTEVAAKLAGKSAAEVRMWLQNVDKNHQARLPTKLADSLNTEYDVGSDWSESVLMREKPSSDEAATSE